MVRGLDWVQKVNGYEVPDNRASGERSACQSGNGALLRAAGLTAKAATQRVRLSPVSDGCSATIEIYPACSGTRLLPQGNPGIAITSGVTHHDEQRHPGASRSQDCRYRSQGQKS